jgi:hypothetical protein
MCEFVRVCVHVNVFGLKFLLGTITIYKEWIIMLQFIVT